MTYRAVHTCILITAETTVFLPGQQSVLVETTEGLVLIAAQAAWTAEEYLAGGDPGTQAHAGLDAQYLSSIELLKQLRAPRVLFSHDDREADDSAGYN